MIPPKPSKYRSRKVTVGGVTYDSQKEAKRHAALRMLELVGEIKDLKRQVEYQLIPPAVINGKKHRAITYRADFVYKENGREIVEDVKGFRTPEYKLKYRLIFAVYGIEIRET